MSWYQVIVLDQDGCTITHTEECTLTAAKRSAREKLQEPGYTDAYKVEVQTEDGECVWDRFYESADDRAASDEEGRCSRAGIDP